jgi:hypothetical protein
MELLENEITVRLLVLNVTLGACPEGSNPWPEIESWVNLPLTEALSITTVAAANDRLVTNNNITRQSKAQRCVTFVLLNRTFA